MFLRTLLPLVSGVLLSGCGASPYTCDTNAQCVDGSGASGICEADGYCSFADMTCATTTRRYADSAGDGKAATCVAATGDTCVADIAGGESSFCMVRTDGTVWCWGANDVGQLGDGTTEDRATPVQAQTPPGKVFAEVRLSENHTCAVATDHTVYCWGGNDVGQLGIVDAAGTPVPDSTTPLQVNAVAGAAPNLTFTPFLAQHIAAGGKHACAVNMAGGVQCWGENSDGQCGQTPPGQGGLDDVLSPTIVPGLTEGTVAISLADESSAALKDDGSVFEFGGNANGQLGIGTIDDSYLPVQTKITSVTSLTAGDEHVCAAKNDGTIWCWGYGVAVGLASGTDQSLPQRVLAAKAVWSGGAAFHTCAVQGGALMCWGKNGSGQLGTGQLDPDQTMDYTPAPALLVSVARTASATGATCAMTVEGGLWCWGANDRGQLALGAPGDPVAVPLRVPLPCN